MEFFILCLQFSVALNLFYSTDVIVLTYLLIDIITLSELSEINRDIYS